MRFLDLHLQAYGPFTDRHLDLSGGSAGLHVVFGLNEAGKSSALRALRALLYGVPERTEDDFLHRKAELRIGGRFQSAAGEELVCYRKKGRKDTLLDSGGKPMAEEVLKGLLGGVDERLFKQLFGIDHASLVSGGQALLAERGREAEALFGTGLGSTAIHSVLEQLDAEAQSLFAPRASKPAINAQLRQLDDNERRLREVSLSARRWEEARRTLSDAQKDLAEVEAVLGEATRRRGTLERIRRSLPGLAKRAQIRDRLSGLGEVPALAEDFGRRREEAVAKRRSAAEALQNARSRLERLAEHSAATEVSEELLAEADAIDALREQLGSHRKAARDRPSLAAKRVALEEQARARLVRARPGLALSDVDTLRPLLGKRRRVTELGGRGAALLATLDKARNDRTENEAELAERRGKLDGLPPVRRTEGLQRAIEAARWVGDLDGTLDDTRRHLLRHDEECGRDLASLGLWEGSLSDLLSAPLPQDETLRRFADRFRALDESRRRIEQRRTDARARQHETEESLRALQLGGAVPSEGELHQARTHRNNGWGLLRRHWLGGEDVDEEARAYGHGAALPAAYEGAVTVADEIADRLRREAQRVHEQAAARARLETCAREAAEAELALGRLGGDCRVLEQSWAEVWAPCALVPLPSGEMLAWLARAERLREKAGKGDELRAQIDGLLAEREGHLQVLRSALTALGEPLAEGSDPGSGPGPAPEALTPILNRAESCLRALDSQASQRKALETNVAELDEAARRLGVRFQAAESELADWRSQWAGAMRELGLPGDASPGEASDALETLLAITQMVDEAAELARRVEGIDTDAREFDRAARGLLGRLAPDLVDKPLDEAIPQLHARLTSHRDARSRLHELRAQAAQAGEEARRAEASILAADQVLRELCQQAGCAAAEALEAIEARFREQRGLIEALRSVENELIEGGDGLGIDALAAEAGSVDRDAVLAELEALARSVEGELKPRQKTLLEGKVHAERDFTAMAGGEEASALAEEAQQTVAALRSLVEQYVRLRLAGRVLRDEIERFRREHRDPILTRASGYFATITRGSFAAVETDFDDADQPILVSVRPTGERLRVEAMSTGSRDQLYLALRLATLDHYLDGSEPLPFIVDDVLVQFDHERARATLATLEGFSAKTQVILFTHHGRVAEQASRLPGAGTQVFVQELG